MKTTSHRYVKLSSDADVALSLGGIVLEFTAGAALNIGDAVYLNSSGLAVKSATATNYATKLGIVVGGYSTNGEILPERAQLGVAATTATGQKVLVLIYGVAYATGGEALGTPGTKITGGVGSSGRVGATGAAAGNFLGLTLEAADGGTGAVKILVGTVV